MTIIRPKQHVVTGINPHNANHRFLIPKRTPTLIPPPEQAINFALRPSLAGQWNFFRSSPSADILLSRQVNQVGDSVPAFYLKQGLLSEPARENLAIYSEDFMSVIWIQIGSTIDPNIALAPDGNLTADQLIEDNTINYHANISSQTPLSGTVATSFYAKSAGRDRVILELGAEYAVFDLSAGQVLLETISGMARIEKSINGWWRCYATVTDVGDDNFALGLVTDANEIVYQGDGISGAYVWGCQIEMGAFATTYIPTFDVTASRAVPSIQRNAGPVVADNFTFHMAVFSERDSTEFTDLGNPACIFSQFLADDSRVEVLLHDTSIEFVRNFPANLSSLVIPFSYTRGEQIDIVFQQSTEWGMKFQVNGVLVTDESVNAKAPDPSLLWNFMAIGDRSDASWNYPLSGSIVLFQWWNSALPILPSGDF